MGQAEIPDESPEGTHDAGGAPAAGGPPASAAGTSSNGAGRNRKGGASWATTPAIRRTMLGNRSRDTAPELKVRRAVHAMGLRYRVASRPEPSLRRTADLVFTRARVAVFIDGCYWHGCPEHYIEPASNVDYWRPKIARNRERDAETTAALSAAGWQVLRFWSHEDPAQVAAAIAEAVRPAESGQRTRRERRGGRDMSAATARRRGSPEVATSLLWGHGPMQGGKPMTTPDNHTHGNGTDGNGTNDAPSLDDVITPEEDALPRRIFKGHAGMPDKLDDEALAAATEEERVAAGLADYAPSQTPPATDPLPEGSSEAADRAQRGLNEEEDAD